MVDRPVLRKVVTTGAISGATFLISNALEQPPIWSVSLGIFIGGVALVVQFLAEFESRLRTATSAFGLIEASALTRDPMVQLVKVSTQLDQAAPSLLHDFARSEIVRFSEFMEGLVLGGDITYEGEDRDWILGLTHSVRSGIDATSMTTASPGGKGLVDERFWTSDLGMRYLQAQRRAVQRGVRIRRIFVLDQPELAADSDLINICALQQSYGIIVRLLSPANIPSTSRTALFDFVLFDEVVSYEMTATSPFSDGVQSTILNTRLELRRSRVQERIQRFRDFWESAHDLSDGPHTCPGGNRSA